MTKDKDAAIQRRYDACMADPDKEKVQQYLDKQWKKAQERYNRLHNPLLYGWASLDRYGKEVLPAYWLSKLVDDALAICGSPYHSMSRQRWGDSAWKYLAEFTGEEQVK